MATSKKVQEARAMMRGMFMLIYPDKRFHYLKCVNPFFKNVCKETKTAELRFNDRDFKVGDYLVLEEYFKDDDRYTGKVTIVQVTDMVSDFPGLVKGWVMLSFKKCEK